MSSLPGRPDGTGSSAAAPRAPEAEPHPALAPISDAAAGAAAAGAAPLPGRHPEPRDPLAELREVLAGRFDVERLLGAGGMGSVYVGRDVTLDRPVAIKVIAPELALAASVRDRFLREARLVARLRHPNIVAVHAAGAGARDGVHDALLYFVMEYVPGESLRERLGRVRRLEGAEALGILRDVARALAAAHAQGVVHRDVKPENVLLDRDAGRAMLTDFGVARALAADDRPEVTAPGRATRTGILLGSPRYMSPEQASGDRTLDGRSDVYALGLVAWEMWVGEAAVQGSSAAAMLVKHLTETPAPLARRAPAAPPAVAAAIDRALAKDPAERPTAAELADVLDAALADLGTPGRGTRATLDVAVVGGPDGAPGRTPDRTPARTPTARTPDAGTPAASTATPAVVEAVTAPTATPDAPNAPDAFAAPPARRRWRGPLAALLLGAAAIGGVTLARPDAPRPAADPRRSYLVVPFEVLSAEPQLEWLHDASASLLTMDLARWTDLTVVDFERALDLLREARLDGRRLGLEDARRLARRARVGTVVLGEITGTPDSLVAVARLYDVATGARVDQAQRSAPRTGDPRLLFDALARDLLDLAGAPALPAAGGAPGAAATTNLAAYRAYLAGVRALNAWRLERADSLLTRAVEADSTFALAWYRRAVVGGWRAMGDLALVERSQADVERALRHASALPPRERDVIAAYRELQRGLHALQGSTDLARAGLAEAERRYAAIAARDSGAVEAWYGLGDARFHRAELASDMPGHVALWNGALRAFDRTIALDSSFHLAYQHRLQLYTLAAAAGSSVLLDGDSLRLLRDVPARRAYGEARFAAAKQRAQLLVVRDARAWVDGDPGATRAWRTLGEAFVVAGFPDSAALALERALGNPDARRPELAYAVAAARMAGADPPAALAALRSALARFPADSMRADASADRFWVVLGAASAAASAGSLADVRRAVAAATAAYPVMELPGAGPLPTEALGRWMEAAFQLGMGAPPDGPARAVLRGVRVLDAVPGNAGRQARVSMVGVPYVAYLATGDERFRQAARTWADTGSFTAFVELDALAALAAGDTARARALSGQFPAVSPTIGFGLGGLRQIARAELFARLGETRRAALALDAIDERRLMPSGFVDVGWPMFARSYLTRGQLWERLGERERAAAAYGRFLALWRDADAAGVAQLRQAREGMARVRDVRPTREVPAGRG